MARSAFNRAYIARCTAMGNAIVDGVNLHKLSEEDTCEVLAQYLVQIAKKARIDPMVFLKEAVEADAVVVSAAEASRRRKPS